MSRWGEGYVTDTIYTVGYYRLQSPVILSLACLLRGVRTFDPTGDEPLSYLELGCGIGYTAMVLAASNPAWRVTAIDFNPSHIAMARRMARDAGLANIQFLEADLTTLAEDPQSRAIPEADVVSFHGLWTWVSDSVRRGIVRLLRAKVRAGGIVHASYNVLPAWQSAIGMQRVLREAGRRIGGRSDRQAQAGLKFVQSLLSAEAPQIKNYGFATSMLESTSTAAPNYLAHEFMNENWKPCFHADIAADLAEAKLEWVASASLPENFDQLTLSETQRALTDQYDDSIMIELIKDMCLVRGLRQDVFVRGGRRVSSAERDAALGDVILGLKRLPEHFDYELQAQIGRVSLEPAFYRPIVMALGEGPQRVRDLLNLPDVIGRRNNPAELVAMLVGTDQAVPVTQRPVLQDDRSGGFNRTTVRHLAKLDVPETRLALASAQYGTALDASVLELLVFAKLDAKSNEVDLDSWVTEALAGREDTDPEKLRGTLGRIVENRVPVWRRFGILP